MNSKQVIVLLIVLLIIANFAFLVPKFTGNVIKENNAIKFGVTLPITGDLANFGNGEKAAIEIAVEEINSNRGINGKKIEIVYEDSKGQISEAVTAYNKIHDYDNIKYVLTHLSSVALAIEPLSLKDKVIQIDVASTTPVYSTPNDYSFRTGIMATQLAKEEANFLYNHLNAKKVAVLYLNDDFGKGMLKIFKENYRGEIVAEDLYNSGDSDFKTQLTKFKSKDFDYLLFVSHLKEGGLIVKQAKEIGLKTKFFADTYSVEGTDFLNNANGAGEGIIYVSPRFDKNDNVSGEFIKKYKEKYNKDPAIFAAQSYDAVIVLSKALLNCNSQNTDCVKDELMKLDYNGTSGLIKFDINGDVKKPVELKTVKNNKFVKYEEGAL